jgi:hypothetical protein
VIDGAEDPIVSVTFRRYDYGRGEMVSKVHAVTLQQIRGRRSG